MTYATAISIHTLIPFYGRCLTVNPKQRITPAGILAHPWIKGGDSISDKNIGAHLTDNLRILQAKKKLRRTVQAIIAVNKFKSAFDSLLSD